MNAAVWPWLLILVPTQGVELASAASSGVPVEPPSLAGVREVGPAAWIFEEEGRLRQLALKPIAEADAPASADERGRIWLAADYRELDTGREGQAWVSRDVVATFSQEPIAEELAPWGVRSVRPVWPARGIYVLEAAAGTAFDLLASWRGGAPPGVRKATPDLAFALQRADIQVPPDDPRYDGQWYLERIQIEGAWEREDGDPSVVVAIVDNGCDLAHPDLAQSIRPGIDVIDGDDDPSFVAAPTCEVDEDCCPEGPSIGGPCCSEGGHCRTGNVHGTACAGIVGADGDNGVGIAGVCPECSLACARLLGSTSTPNSAVIEVYAWVVEQGIDVVSNSWSYVNAMAVPSAVADGIRMAQQQGRDGKGAVIVFAAGNEDRIVGPDELQAMDGILTVGATTIFDERTSFSNRGPELDLAAPGGTLTTDISGPDGDGADDYTDDFGGTSAACPVVAGVAGLALSASPDLTAAELKDLLVSTARPAPFGAPDADGHDPDYGFGIVDPVAALSVLVDADPEPAAGVDAGAGTDPDDPPPFGCGQSPFASFPTWAVLVALFARRRRRRARFGRG